MKHIQQNICEKVNYKHAKKSIDPRFHIKAVSNTSHVLKLFSQSIYNGRDTYDGHIIDGLVHDTKATLHVYLRIITQVFRVSNGSW